MNYCLIEDAWKNTDYLANTTPNNKNIEYFDYNTSQNNNCIITCDNFMDHLNTCNDCKKKLRNIQSSKILEYIKNIIIEYKDTLLLILIIIFILVFFKLLISIFNK